MGSFRAGADPLPLSAEYDGAGSAWTQQLGNAVLTRRAEAMDAVQRMRRQAYGYGYLRTNPYDTVVDSGGYIEVLPVNPADTYVPAYDQLVVFGPPRLGFEIAGAIRPSS